MGDQNQLLYFQKFARPLAGAVLEIGSKDYGSTVPFRQHLQHTEYVGLDLAPGKGVDVVGDLTTGLCGLPEAHYSLVICCSVLEHVERPWKMAENIARLTKPGGSLFISVPWAWRYHPYPDDFFRFSWRGIETLFPGFSWSNRHYSTTVTGEFIEILEHSRDADNRLVKAFELEGGGTRKYLPFLALNMMGTRTTSRHQPPE